MVRASLLEVLALDYVRTARAKGLAKPVVIMRHALPNAMLPTLTLVGLQFGSLLGGAAIIETVFALKGLERIGDHAKNIAEQVVFALSGQDLRHRKQARSPAS